MSTKVCSKCLIEQPVENFSIEKRTKDGLRTQCKSCTVGYSTKWKKEQIKIRDYQKVQYNGKLKREFGVTIKEYNELLKGQNFCCLICGVNKNEFKNRMPLDHNHQTNQIRGILCSKCNMGLGLFKENIQNLQKAIDYLNLFNNL